jgi:hypothetical protein
MTIGAADTSQKIRYLLPHRVRRVAPKAVLLGLIAALLTGIRAEPAKAIVLASWIVIACFVLVRTWRAAISVDDTSLVAVTGIARKRLLRSEIAWIDLRLPQVGQFTPGGGARIVAVMKDGKQRSLAFDPLVRRDCRHLAKVVRSLNGLVDQRPDG